MTDPLLLLALLPCLVLCLRMRWPRKDSGDHEKERRMFHQLEEMSPRGWRRRSFRRDVNTMAMAL
jgi:hypothetical protein